MNNTSGEVQAIACDMVLLQTGRASQGGLEKVLRGAGLESHAIGDCVTPRRMSHAVLDAQKLAQAL